MAIERVTGTLNGHKGSFVFQHAGIMSRGDQQLSISVVPDSGTEQLTGISGVFSLTIVDGKQMCIRDRLSLVLNRAKSADEFTICAFFLRGLLHQRRNS